jgi:hypothetical protein
MNDENPKIIPIKDVRQEKGAHELASSPDMEPYLKYIMASMQGADVQPQLDALSKLSLETRYVWRVASALKWAFADCETMNVEADRRTISQEDRLRLIELLKHRPLQFCLFLSALLGEKQMEALMISAIKDARVIAPQSEE